MIIIKAQRMQVQCTSITGGKTGCIKLTVWLITTTNERMNMKFKGDKYHSSRERNDIPLSDMTLSTYSIHDDTRINFVKITF